MTKERAIKLALVLIAATMAGLMILKGSTAAILLAFIGLVLVVLL